MKSSELRPHIGLFGEIKALTTKSYSVTIHGVLRDVSPRGNLIWLVDNDGFGHAFLPQNIESFTPKEFEGLPSEYKGKEIYWTGGRAYYKATNKECNLDK